MIWAIIVLLIIAAFFIIGDFGTDKQKEIEKKKLFEIETAGNFPAQYKAILNPDKTTKLTLVEPEDKFVIHMFNQSGTLEEKIIPFEKIIEAEVSIDDSTVTKVSKGSQITGAVVGGLAAGSVGALVGGLSSNKTETKFFKKIDLKLKLDDFSSPIYRFDFLPSKDDFGLENLKGFTQNDPKVKDALSNAEVWQGIMEIAIRKANKVAQ
ncbi:MULTISPECIES: hypothetical protein [Bacillus]|uniref:Immunity protein n=1 Tax=Bacillus velezensis TaxID=492670 RepID=A0A7W4QGS9_BACVE|nr:MULTISPECIES: hypothetical protein [Bacillus]MEC0378122.1 hypothetical protein [Bacillus velezensis]MEE4532814.1 hypothetical protein [Bacillus velezensis]QOY28975.1 hypothetical protein BACVE_004017 [Bacillus velezensis]RXJ47136.1 hypothetical protein ES962_05325 [Bacillus velezensis]WBQ87860.1 hypothetical protein OVA33_15885 [Bacillus sp. KICET-1]